MTNLRKQRHVSCVYTMITVKNMLIHVMVLVLALSGSSVQAQTITPTPRPTFSFNETTSAPGPGIMQKSDDVDATSFSLAILGIFLGLAFIAGVCCFYTQRKQAQQEGVIMDDEKNMYIEVKTRKAPITRDSSLWIVNSNVNEQKEDCYTNTSNSEGYKAQKPVNLSVLTSISASN